MRIFPPMFISFTISGRFASGSESDSHHFLFSTFTGCNLLGPFLTGASWDGRCAAQVNKEDLFHEKLGGKGGNFSDAQAAEILNRDA